VAEAHTHSHISPSRARLAHPSPPPSSAWGQGGWVEGEVWPGFQMSTYLIIGSSTAQLTLVPRPGLGSSGPEPWAMATGMNGPGMGIGLR
jgi:hypothetical protein